ncbi:MAG: hypothetical protein KDD55_01230 [Bdellovibrionales bacterium]|nr:hypothetical protein [Bdellovibrionales bacterium]
MEVKDRFDEIFSIEVEGWCYGIQNYPGEVFPGLIHAVIRELKPSYKAAVQHFLVFDVLTVSKNLSRASKYLVHEKEIAFCILAQLPNPSELDEDEQFVLAQIIDQVEQAYGGALDRLQRKWAYERRLEQDKAA